MPFNLLGNTFDRVWPGGTASCQKTVGEGEFTSGTKGVVDSLRFQGCKWGSFNCTTPGFSAGEVDVSDLNVTPVYLDAAQESYGLLLSPQSGAFGVFAQMKCAFGVVPVSWTGSVITEIRSPDLNVSATVFENNLKSNGYNQVHQQIEEKGTEYHLSQSVNGGSPEPLGLNSVINMNTPVNAEFEP